MSNDLVDGFEEKPDLGDRDECQVRGCDTYPRMAVRYRGPDSEYLVYCRDHADEMFHECEDAKYRTRLRP